MTQETIKKVSVNLITGAVLFALTAAGQAVHTHFTVQKQAEQIETLEDVQEDYITNRAFLRYVELAEERNKYLKEGIDKNAESLEIIEQKIDRELAKIRDAIGFKYRK